MENKTDRTFKWIWRINGISLLLVSIVGFIAIAVMFINIGFFTSQNNSPKKVNEIAGNNLASTSLKINNFSSIMGTSLLFAHLSPHTGYSSSSSNLGGYNSKNILFFDTVTHKVHWLFKENIQKIRTLEFLTSPVKCKIGSTYSACEESKITTALLLELEADNHDSKIPDIGKRRIAIAEADGTNLHELVEGVDRIQDVHAVDATKTLVFYTKAGTVRYLDIDPVKRIVRSDQELSSVN